MEIRSGDVYRAMLRQLTADIHEINPSGRGRALVDFVDFVMSDATADGASAIKDLLEKSQIEPWDEPWVVQEMARATLDALTAWQSVANVVLERLNSSDDTETTRALRDGLAMAYKTVVRLTSQLATEKSK
jgi:hypothetical protein